MAFAPSARIDSQCKCLLNIAPAASTKQCEFVHAFSFNNGNIQLGLRESAAASFMLTERTRTSTKRWLHPMWGSNPRPHEQNVTLCDIKTSWQLFKTATVCTEYAVSDHGTVSQFLDNAP
eukprot:15367165-Ditylum_brightwellii.AAC.1